VLGHGFMLLETADKHHVTPAGKVQHVSYARLKRVG